MSLEINDQSQKIELIKQSGEHFALLTREVGKVIIGNQNVIESIIIAILCNGHILLEGVPGVAKTTMIKAISDSLGFSFKRIQFTPDLLPADVIGTLIYNPKTQEFETKKGPVFANIVLADEINRAPAKVQSALLEAMQEHQVTLGSETFKLPKPFFVFATQNPIEQEGTYQLPEAQLDRFMFKLNVTYPSKADEKEILQKTTVNTKIKSVLSADNVLQAQKLVDSIYIDEKIVEYIVNIVHATRHPKDFKLSKLSSLISMGASPRASIAIYHASKAHAFMAGRYFVTPEDVKRVAPSILRHRLILSYEAQADEITADSLIEQVLNTVITP
jgi:MoxR-like ATPase